MLNAYEQEMLDELESDITFEEQAEMSPTTQDINTPDPVPLTEAPMLSDEEKLMLAKLEEDVVVGQVEEQEAPPSPEVGIAEKALEASTIDFPVLGEEADKSTTAFLIGLGSTMQSGYNGVKQILGFDDEEEQEEARFMRALSESDYGTASTAGEITGYIVEPIGLAIPMGKAATAMKFARNGAIAGGSVGFIDFVEEDTGESRLGNATLGAVLGGGVGLGVGKLVHRGAKLPKDAPPGSVAPDMKSDADVITEFETLVARRSKESGLGPEETIEAMRSQMPEMVEEATAAIKKTGVAPDFVQTKKDLDFNDRIKETGEHPDAVRSTAKDFGKDTAGAWGSFVQGVDKLMGSISSRMKKHSPQLYKRVQDYEYTFKTYPKAIQEKTQAFREFFPTHDRINWKLQPKRTDDHLSESLTWELKKALVNGDVKQAQGIMSSFGGKKGVNALNNTLQMFRDEGAKLQQMGVLPKLTENYFPRVVPYRQRAEYLEALKDYFTKKKNTKAAAKFESKDILEEYEKARAVKEKALGRDFNEFEESQFFSRWFLEDYSSGSKQLDRTMKRGFKKVPDELVKFYADPIEAIERWSESMAAEVAKLKLLGDRAYKAGAKRVPETGVFDETTAVNEMGDVLEELKVLDDDARREVLGLLKLRLGNGLVNTSQAVKYYKALNNSFLLGNPFSALIQLGDIPVSAYRFGIKEAIQGVAKSMSKGSKLTREDLGLERMFVEAEWAKGSPLEEFQNFMFRWSGFSAADRVGKNALLNTALVKYSKGAGKPGSSGYKMLARKYEKAWGSQFGDLVNDFKKYGKTGKQEDITDNMRTVLFTELAQVQPISLSEMPESVLRSNTQKFFWTLKSFMLKQMDIIRNDVYQEMKMGIKTGDKAMMARGASNMLKFMATVGAGNFTVQEARQFISGRESFETLQDKPAGDALGSFALASMLHTFKLFSVDEYLWRDIQNNGLAAGLFGGLAPPIPVADSLVQGRGLSLPGVGSVNRLSDLKDAVTGGGGDGVAGFAEGGLVGAVSENRHKWVTVPVKKEDAGDQELKTLISRCQGGEQEACLLLEQMLQGQGPTGNTQFLKDKAAYDAYQAGEAEAEKQRSTHLLPGGSKDEELPPDATVVVRMNHGGQEDCDIWVDNVSHLPCGKNLKLGEHKEAVIANTLLPDLDYKWLVRRLEGAKPSTGIMVAYYFLLSYPENTKYITGYNGKINRYRNRKMLGPHDWKLERKLLEEWIRDEIFRPV